MSVATVEIPQRNPMLTFFQSELQSLRTEKGLSYGDMEARYRTKLEERRETHSHLKPIVRSTFCKAVTAVDAPSWEVVRAFVIACDGNVQEWHRLYRLLHVGLRELSPKPTPEKQKTLALVADRLAKNLAEPCGAAEAFGRRGRVIFGVLPVRHGPSYPRPNGVTNAARFGREMRRLQYLSRLSLRTIAQQAAERGRSISVSALSALLSPKAARMPRPTTLIAFLTGLGTAEGDIRAWLNLLDRLRRYRDDPESALADNLLIDGQDETLGRMADWVSLSAKFDDWFTKPPRRPDLHEAEAVPLLPSHLPVLPPRWARRAKPLPHGHQHARPLSLLGAKRPPALRGRLRRGRSRQR